MNANHQVQRDLGGSGEANERLIRVALDNGALGAKLAGAGDGGTIIALTMDPEGLERALVAGDCESVLHPCPVEGVCLEDEAADPAAPAPAEGVA